MSDGLDALTTIISKPLNPNEKTPDLLASVKALFGTRYYQNIVFDIADIEIEGQVRHCGHPSSSDRRAEDE